jgi:hypothetical protein
MCPRIEKCPNSDETINIQRLYYIPFFIGKFFRKTNQILLVEGKGDNWVTLIHELLHSIQKCSPKRESITDFLTFIITKNINAIESRELTDWDDIMRLHGISAIKQRFLKMGNCEDF